MEVKRMEEDATNEWVTLPNTVGQTQKKSPLLSPQLGANLSRAYQTNRMSHHISRHVSSAWKQLTNQPNNKLLVWCNSCWESANLFIGGVLEFRISFRIGMRTWKFQELKRTSETYKERKLFSGSFRNSSTDQTGQSGQSQLSGENMPVDSTDPTDNLALVPLITWLWFQ